MTDTATTADAVPGLIGRLRAQLGERRELKRFIKFMVVGGIGFIIDFGVSNLMWSILPPSLVIPLPFGREISYIGIGGAMGFITAIISNFVWNRFWTYPESRSKHIAGQFATFLAINLVGIAIRIPILELATMPLASLIGTALPGLGVTMLPFLGPEIALRLGKNGALVIAVVVVLFWNFFVNRYITYSDVDRESSG